ncbi:unnamed protein product, partial [Medioppia subpectinata]
MVTNHANHVLSDNNNNNTIESNDELNAKTSHSNDVIIYEINSYDETYDSSYGTSDSLAIGSDATDDDINHYQNIINRLSADKCRLNDEIMGLEDQVMDLMSDRESADKSFRSQLDSLRHKIEANVESIDELRQSVDTLETMNETLRHTVDQKVKQNHELVVSLRDIEEKCFLAELKLKFSEIQLSEAIKTESHLRHTLNVTEKALNSANICKYETIERLNELSMYCTDRDKHINELNLQMDSLKQRITDRDNELWFFSDVCYVNSLMKRRRITNAFDFSNLCLLPSILETQFDCFPRSVGGEQTSSSIGHELCSDTRMASNASSRSSSLLNRKKSLHKKSCDKNIPKDCVSSAMNSIDDQLYEKLSDFDHTNGDIYYEGKNNSEDMEAVVNSDDDLIDSETSSTKSSLFPSLPDVILRKLQLLRESSCSHLVRNQRIHIVAAKNKSVESLTEEEIESKFTTLSLAFKTDKFTLEQRVNLQRHQRDVSELDANNELQCLRESVRELNELMFGLDDDFALMNSRTEGVKELLTKIETQVDVVAQTNAKISSRSELYGAVKQEERMSGAFDVILIHSQNLRKESEKCRKELEKTKQLLNSMGTKKLEFESDSDNESVPLRRSIRSISTTIVPKTNLIRVRRASVSSIVPNSEKQRKTMQPKYVAPKPSYLANRSRRCSMPATSAIFRSRSGVDIETSFLEITAEEKGGSESDCGSSLVNPDSDNEQTEQISQPLSRRKSSLNEINIASINCEH